MNTKDIITITIVGIIIIGLLYGLILLIKNKPENTQITKKNQETLLNDQLDNTGFEQRAKNQQDLTTQNKTNETTGSAASNTQQKKLQRPQMTLNDNVDYKAEINTSKGMIVVDLFEKEAPVTVNNFVYLAKSGFYDKTIFHRIINDFMIQGGDPTGTGTGGPGYSFEDEINNKKLIRGSLAMANSGKNTNGSQFFIVTKESTPWLDGLHTNFGEVVQGMDIVNKIQNVKTDARDKPTENVIIENIKIYEKPIN